MRDRFKQSGAQPSSNGDIPGLASNATNQTSCLTKPRIKSHRTARKSIPSLRWPLILFLVGLVVPWMITVGSLRLSVYRIVLLVTILPCLSSWMSGKAGRIRIPDITLLLFWAWCALSLVVSIGLLSSLQTIGILWLETLGPYLLARCYIRDAEAFTSAIRLWFRIVLFLCPFAIVETVFGQ